MGAAKLKTQLILQAEAALHKVDIPTLAGAVRKLILAAGGNIGSDCYTHAALGVAILERLDIPAEIVSGYAAWRVGEGDGDVVAHVPQPSPSHALPNAFMYHTWIEVAGRILDLSTYQLRAKAAQLDAMDGQHTQVGWCPDYLFTEKKACRSYSEVAKQHTGLFYYARDILVERKLAGGYKRDSEDEEAVWMIYCHPELNIVGPNDLAGVRP